jgi:hypothetical protein
VNPAPDEEFKSIIGNREIETALAEPGEFFGNGQSGYLALRVRAKRSEHDFLVEAPDQLRSEKPMQLGNYRSLQRREGKPGRAKKLLSTDIAGADDLEAGKIIATVVSQRNAGRIEHLQEEIPNEAVGLLNFVEQQNASLMARASRMIPAARWSAKADSALVMISCPSSAKRTIRLAFSLSPAGLSKRLKAWK